MHSFNEYDDRSSSSSIMTTPDKRLRRRDSSLSPTQKVQIGEVSLDDEEKNSDNYHLIRKSLDGRFTSDNLVARPKRMMKATVVVVMMLFTFSIIFFTRNDRNEEIILTDSSTIIEEAPHHQDTGLDGNSSNTPFLLANEKHDHNSCSIFLAQSSIPNGGMGIFTTSPIRKGDIILTSDGPSIPIIDKDSSDKSQKAWIKLFNNYWWAHGQSDVAKYEADNVIEFLNGAAGLPNSHAYLNNILFLLPDIIPYDDSRLDRTKNPAAGAISYHMGRSTVAKQDIDAGDELLMRYPKSYMNYISNKYNIPKKDDYEKTGMAVLQMYQLYGNNFHDWDLNDTLISSLNERSYSLLPKTQSDLDRVLSRSNSSKKHPDDEVDMGTSIAKEMSVEKRSPEWIRENGVCMDNWLPGKSTNPEAGLGAIAHRFMKKGDVIAYASILQVTDRDALRIPAFTGDKWQLALNYCISHQHSSLLLCPNTNVNWINHCSNRRPDIHPCGNNDSPNAEYRWADWDQTSNEWLDMTVEEMKSQSGKGLFLELVSTRDIEPGEEVFIDYGIEFENAWDNHIRDWKLHHENVKNESWVSMKELNDELAPLDLAPSFSDEHTTSENHKEFSTMCYYHEHDDKIWYNFDKNESWKKMSKAQIIEKYGKKYNDDTYLFTRQIVDSSEGRFWPCIIGDVGGKEDTYIVRILQSPHKSETRWHRYSLPRIILDFPRNSIRHFYRPYHSDVHLPNVFRHYIGFSDDSLFPEKWRNLKPQG